MLLPWRTCGCQLGPPAPEARVEAVDGLLEAKNVLRRCWTLQAVEALEKLLCVNLSISTVEQVEELEALIFLEVENQPLLDHLLVPERLLELFPAERAARICVHP